MAVLRCVASISRRFLPFPTGRRRLHATLMLHGEISEPGRYLFLPRKMMRSFLDQVVGLGYKLSITELDVNDRDRIGSIEQRDADVATLTRGWLDLLFSYPQTRDVLVWGMSDRYSWLQSFAPRSDGLPVRPLPYDRDFQAKPMRSNNRRIQRNGNSVSLNQSGYGGCCSGVRLQRTQVQGD